MQPKLILLNSIRSKDKNVFYISWSYINNIFDLYKNIIMSENIKELNQYIGESIMKFK